MSASVFKSRAPQVDLLARMGASEEGGAPEPELSWDLLERVPLDQFTDDVSRDIYKAADIYKRYGLTASQGKALCERPEVDKLIAIKRAIWASDENMPERFRTYCQVGLLEASPRILSMLQDENVNAAVRVDLVKTLTKVAGMEAPPPPRERLGDIGTLGPTGPTFSVNILFQGRTETITTINGDLEEQQRLPTVVRVGDEGEDEEDVETYRSK